MAFDLTPILVQRMPVDLPVDGEVVGEQIMQADPLAPVAANEWFAAVEVTVGSTSAEISVWA